MSLARCRKYTGLGGLDKRGSTLCCGTAVLKRPIFKYVCAWVWTSFESSVVELDLQEDVEDRAMLVRSTRCILHDLLLRFVLIVDLTDLFLDICRAGLERLHTNAGIVPTDIGRTLHAHPLPPLFLLLLT